MDEPGVQTIRLIFDKPQRLRCISPLFEEAEAKRTQEFAFRWSPDRGSSFREIVRRHCDVPERHLQHKGFIRPGFGYVT